MWTVVEKSNRNISHSVPYHPEFLHDSPLNDALKPCVKYLFVAEVPGSPVPEPKLRDSRFKSRLGIGLGIDIRAM